MVSQSGNIFSLKDYGDFGKWGRGEAYTSGTYDFTAQMHRGIELNAENMFKARLGIKGLDVGVVKAAKAAFVAGAEVEGGLSLIAIFPLDLFEEAGVVVCFQAQAKASGVGMAKIELDANTFYKMVRKELQDQAKSQWLDLAEIFFEEVVFEAGLSVMVSFSAGITAEAFMVGCLLPTSDDKEAGFTFSVQYSAGFKYGYGMRYLSNIGFKNPQQLLNRLSDKMVYIIEDALTQHISSDNIEAQQEAMAYFRLFLPVAMRTAFTLGYDLVKSQQPNQQQATAKTSVVQSFVSEVQKMLLSSLFDLAMHEMNMVLEKEQFITKLKELINGLSEEELDKIGTILINLIDKLQNFSTIGNATPEEWFNAVVELLDPLMEIMDLNLFGDEDKESWQKNVAHFWAIAILVRHTIDWVSSEENGSESAQFKEITVEIPVSLRNYLTEKIPPNPNLPDLEKLILVGIEERMAILADDAFPEKRDLLECLVRIFGVSNNSSLVQKLLQEPENLSTDDILQGLSNEAGGLIEDKVFPELNRLVEKDRDLDEIINQVVKPALISIPYIVLPGISKLDEDGMDKKLREQVSAVLLLFLSRLLLTSTNVLTKEALTQGSGAIGELAELAKKGEQTDFLTMSEAYIAISTLGMSCLATPPAVSATTKSSADVIDYLNSEKRENLLDSIEKLIYLGVSTGVKGVESVWTTLENTDDPPLKGELEKLAENQMTDARDLLFFVTGESLKTLGKGVEQCGKGIIDMVGKGFWEIVKIANDFVEKFDDVIEKIDGFLDVNFKDLDELKRELGDLVEKWAGILSNQRFIDDTIDHIRDEGWKYVNSNIPKKFKKYSEKYVSPIYYDFFNKNKFLLVYPLQSFIPNLAYCANLEVEEQLNLGRTLDKNILIKKLKKDALKTSISEMKIPVKIKITIFGKKIRKNLGTFTLPGNLIIGYAIDYVFSRTDVNDAIGNIVNKGNEISRKRIERDNLQAKIDKKYINKQKAEEKINKLFTGKDLRISIFSPEERITYDDEADLHVVLSGANKSFVEFELGVPKRVKLYINENEYNYSGENWVEDGENLVFKAKLAIGEIEAIKPINNPVHDIYETASLSQHRSSQKIPGDEYVIIPRPIQFQRIAEFERYSIRKWYSISFKTIEENRELFYFCYWPPYGWPGYKPRDEPVLYPGLNIVHVVAANGDENNEKSEQAVRIFYLNKVR